MKLFTRRKTTGEPGNGGSFAGRRRPDAATGLLPAVPAPVGWDDLDADGRVDSVTDPGAEWATLEYVSKAHAADDRLMRALASAPAATPAQLDVAADSKSWHVRFAVAENANTRQTTLTRIENAARAERAVQREAADATEGFDANIHRRAAESLQQLAAAASASRGRAGV
jgi:hypothetical protein